MPDYRALIFDLDGVVIDSEPLHDRAALAVMEAHGIEIDDTLFDRFRGTTDQDLMRYVARAHAPHLDADRLVREKMAHYQTLLRDVAPIPGAVGVIRSARARFEKVALTTSAQQDNQRIACTQLALMDVFDVIVTAADIDRPKPDPQPYERTVERLGVRADACLVVEDSVNGVRSAAGAGCAVAGLTTTFDAAQLRDAGADFTFDDYAELAERLGL